MADSKITALASIGTGTDPANDPLVIVDVSDILPGGMSLTGTTKKVTLNNLLACSPTATLASATITGAATVGTTLGVTGVATFAAGTALLPALTTTGDTNTGIYYPAADTFAVTAGGSERFRIDSSGNVGIGVTPITSHILSCSGPVGITGTFSGTRTSYITNASAASIYYTDGGGSGYFTDFGNLIIQPRTSAARSVVIATGSTTPVERAVVKSTGQVRFVPLAADPSGAEAGDVYYNSVSNRLKYYNGTAWTLI